MWPCPGQYVKVIYDFESSYPSELNLRKGDIVLVTTVVNENWLCGKLGNQEGNFPVSFVGKLVLPSIQKGQKVFAAIENFHAQEEGDLDFCRGDVIVGVCARDSNWWCGSLAGKNSNGIFPLTHVFELNHKSDAIQSKTSSVEGQVVRALVDSTPQLDEELGFKAGDHITIIEVVDDDWYIGECRGKQGMFLTSCVEFLDPTLKSLNTAKISSASLSRTTAAAAATSFNLSRTSHTYNSENTRSYDTSVTPYARTLYPFNAQAGNELTFNANEIVLLLCHVDSQWIKGELDGKTGIFPSSYVDIIVDCPHLEADISNVSTCSSIAEEAAAPLATDSVQEECYGLVKYNFKAETSGDLNLKEGDTIIILQQVDMNWFLAKNDDNEIGHCPVNHIDVIGSEPKFLSAESSFSNTEVSGSNVLNDAKTKPECSSLYSNAEKGNGYQDKENNNIYSNQSKETSCSVLPAASKPSPQLKPILKPKPVVVPKPSFSPSPSNSLNRPPRPHSISGTSNFDTHGLNSLIENEIQKEHRKSYSPILDRNENMDYGGSSGRQVKLNINDQMVYFGDKTSASSSASPLVSALSTSPQSRKAKRVSLEGLPNLPESQDKPSSKPVPIRRPPPPPQRSYSFGANTGALNDKRSSLRKSAPPRPSGSRPSPSNGTSHASNGKVVHRKVSDRMIPSRPAPARPPPRSAPSSKRKSQDTSDLITFSPNSSITGTSDDPCARLADLNISIIEIEHSLEKCQSSRSKLLSEMVGANDEKRQKLQEEVENVNAETTKLQEQHQNLKAQLRQLRGEEPVVEKVQDEIEAKKHKEQEEKKKAQEKKRMQEIRQKMKEKRENVIQELLGTEHDFHYDLQLCIGYFLSPSVEKIPGVDLEVMFGNIEEICEISSKLLRSMELAAKSDFDNQLLGPCFVHLAEEMKQAYGPYCKNHDDVITLLEKYEDNPQIKEYFEQRLQCMRQLTNVFDLGSILIKPIQRILKYPLLLSELLKTTDDEHPDKKEIQIAIDSMTDVAKSINEYKRRKDLVFKYKKDSDETIGEKFAKLNFHSIKKKSTRMKGRLSNNLGISLQTKDEQFEKIEIQFRSIEKVIKVFLRDVDTYLKQLDEYVICWENLCADIVTIYNDAQSEELKCYMEATNLICTQYYPEFKSTVETLVISPLNQLQSLFLGPNKVIQKRFDKLLDYDSLARKSKIDKANDVHAAQCDYEALNAQLLDELPLLCQFAQQLFKDCICCYNRSQGNFYDNIVKKMYTLLTLPFLMSMPDNILDSFQVLHSNAVDMLSNLGFIPRGFGPKVMDNKPERKLSRQFRITQSEQETPVNQFQEASHKADVLQKYQGDKLYLVVTQYNGSDNMEISVNVGDVVGVIKEQDPMGNKEKWFVDNGAAKGFIPKSVLSAYKHDGKKTDTTTIVDDSDTDEQHIYAEIIDKTDCLTYPVEKSIKEEWPHVYEQTVEPDTQQGIPAPTDELYIAEYPFSSGGQNQVSLFEGQVVTVLAKQDMEANTEWWMVDADGEVGYAPAAYLTKIDATPT